METQQTHKALLCALCQIEHDNAASVPAMIWQIIGNDAILEGFNEAMSRLTEGGIENALGAVMSEYSSPVVLKRLLESARTGRVIAYECVRTLRAGPGTYRLITVMRPTDDDRVILYAIPLERLDAERVCRTEAT